MTMTKGAVCVARSLVRYHCTWAKKLHLTDLKALAKHCYQLAGDIRLLLLCWVSSEQPQGLHVTLLICNESNPIRL